MSHAHDFPVSYKTASKQTGTIIDASNSRGQASYSKPAIRLVKRRELVGHFGKVYAAHWAGDSIHLVSAAQDGKMIVWNAMNTYKVQNIHLKSHWVMTCAFEQSRNVTVASGGLDNTCTVFPVGENAGGRGGSGKELLGHEGYISCCRFSTEKNILTSSGDSTARYWDTEKGKQIQSFTGHSADVMCLSQDPTNQSIFVTSSCDTTAKVWDLRNGDKCVQNFVGHLSDVNSVSYFPDGNAVVTGSDDTTCRIFDLRCSGEVNSLASDKVVCGVTSVDFSKSGHYVFGGYEDGMCRVWDVLKGRTGPIMTLSGHESRVMHVCVNPRGDAVSTASWDSNVRIWA